MCAEQALLNTHTHTPCLFIEKFCVHCQPACMGEDGGVREEKGHFTLHNVCQGRNHKLILVTTGIEHMTSRPMHYLVVLPLVCDIGSVSAFWCMTLVVYWPIGV